MTASTSRAGALRPYSLSRQRRCGPFSSKRLTDAKRLLSCLAWLGALQSLRMSPAPMPGLESTARLVGIASLLGTLTVLIYRLGVWRQGMESTKHNIGGDVKAHREESAANFDRIERRLEAIDHMLAASSDHRARAVRWQSRTERRLERLENLDARHTA
jgi:hypothetical protein